MDREYLEDYEQREREEYRRLVEKRIEEGKFDFEKDRYPPKERFVKLQKPVAITSLTLSPRPSHIWSQIPFCGSLVVPIFPMQPSKFETEFFRVSEIPKIIDFIKETGKMQIVLGTSPEEFEGFDYLEPFFIELNPPQNVGLPPRFLGEKKEQTKAQDSFYTLAGIKYLDFLKEQLTRQKELSLFSTHVNASVGAYVTLKLSHYAIVEDIENALIDDPLSAFWLLRLCDAFITAPIVDTRHDLSNFSFDEFRLSRVLPITHRPQEIRFPCEIGKFLLKKLTYAAQDMRACYYLMDNYDAYDLRKVQKALNEAIVTNNPDIVNKSVEEFSEILDNVWNDKTIPQRVKDLRIGIPLFLAAIGSVAAGPIGATGGFLAGLGYNLVEKTIDLNTEGLSERLAKLKTKSHQANVYDFKKKYKERMVKE